MYDKLQGIDSTCVGGPPYEGGSPYEGDIPMNNRVNIVFMVNLEVMESFLTILEQKIFSKNLFGKIF